MTVLLFWFDPSLDWVFLHNLMADLCACSPFKASSVKTKVEAFEAVLSGSKASPAVLVHDIDDIDSAVLPQARVMVHRLTKDDVNAAGGHGQSPQLPPASAKRGTFVKPFDDQPEPLDGSNRTADVKEERRVRHRLFLLSADRNGLLPSVVVADLKRHLSPKSARVIPLMSSFQLVSGFFLVVLILFRRRSRFYQLTFTEIDLFWHEHWRECSVLRKH